MKRFLKWVALLIVMLVLGVVGTGLFMFASRKPVEDGEVLPGNVVTVRDGYTTVYMLDAGDGTVVLIDAGYDGEAAAIKGALQKRGVGPEKVAAVLLTHGHADHIGGLPQLPSAQVFALATDEPLVEGAVISASPFGRIMGKPKATGLHVTRRLADGDKVTIGKLEISVFAVPGHTGGSAAYLIGRTLFLGDSADASRGGELLPAAWIFSESTAQNVASLKALASKLEPVASDISTMAFSHSGPLTSFTPLAEFAAKH